jgi:hypothetical protein
MREQLLPWSSTAELYAYQKRCGACHMVQMPTQTALQSHRVVTAEVVTSAQPAAAC